MRRGKVSFVGSFRLSAAVGVFAILCGCGSTREEFPPDASARDSAPPPETDGASPGPDTSTGTGQDSSAPPSDAGEDGADAALPETGAPDAGCAEGFHECAGACVSDTSTATCGNLLRSLCAPVQCDRRVRR